MVLVYAYRLGSDGSFKPEHIGYITFIFDNIYDSSFSLVDSEVQGFYRVY